MATDVGRKRPLQGDDHWVGVIVQPPSRRFTVGARFEMFADSLCLALGQVANEISAEFLNTDAIARHDAFSRDVACGFESKCPLYYPRLRPT